MEPLKVLNSNILLLEGESEEWIIKVNEYQLQY